MAPTYVRARSSLIPIILLGFIALLLFLPTAVFAEANDTNNTSQALPDLNNTLTNETTYNDTNGADNDIYFNRTINNDTLANDTNEIYINNSLTNISGNDTSNNTYFKSILNLISILANSASYFAHIFALGLQGAIAQGSEYNAISLLAASQSSTRNAQGNSYTANIGLFAGTVPSQFLTINSYSIYPKSAIVGSIVRFGISTQNSQAAWLKITLPDSSQETINLINNGYVYYVAISTGRYNVTFYANSTSGTIASATDYFEAASAQPTPILQPPSGGGAGEFNCTTIWDCDSWSICSNGIQARTCVNKGTCPGTSTTPTEERVCSAHLFDLDIKLKNVALIGNESLKLNVSLIETKG